MIRDIFRTEGAITGGQTNFLKVIARLPEIKNAMGDVATAEDVTVANEAKSLLGSTRKSL